MSIMSDFKAIPAPGTWMVELIENAMESHVNPIKHHMKRNRTP